MTQLPQPQQEESAHQMLQDFLFVLRVHKWKVVLITMAVSLLAALITFSMRPVYESTADLYLRPGREQALDEIHKEAGDVGVTKANTSEIIKTELEIMQSPDLIDLVIDRLLKEGRDLENLMPEVLGEAAGKPGFLARLKAKLIGLMGGGANPPNPRAVILVQIADNLDIRNTRDTRMIHLVYQGPDPAFTKLLLDTYIAAYIELHRQMTQTSGQVEHFKKTLESLERELMTKRRTLQKAMDKVGYSSLDGQMKAALDRLTGMQNQFYEIQREESRAKVRLVAIRKGLKVTEAMVVTSLSESQTGWTAMARMREVLFELEVRLEDLKTRYKGESPRVKEVRKQVAAAMRILNGESNKPTITRGINPIYQYLVQEALKEEAELEAAMQIQKTLERQLEATRTEVDRLDHIKNETELAVKSLTMEIENLEASIKENMGKLRRAETLELQAAENITNVKVARKPRVDLTPRGPKNFRNIVIGALLGLFVGASISLVIELLNNTIRKRDAVGKQLGLPVVGMLRVLKTKAPSAVQKR